MDHIIAIQIPIHWDRLSQIEKVRFERKRKRDSKVIYKYLGIIKQEQKTLISKPKSKYQINKGKLDLMTLTTRDRKSVKYDQKSMFPRMSTDEFLDCRDTAAGNYLGTLELSKSQDSNSVLDNSNHPILSRTILKRDQKGKTKGTFYLKDNILSLRDSMDSNWRIVNGQNITVTHSRLNIPLKLSKYHEEQLSKGNAVSLIFSERDGVKYANISIKWELDELDLSTLARAVMGIDLGYTKTAYTVLMTEDKILHRNTWHSDEKFSV